MCQGGRDPERKVKREGENGRCDQWLVMGRDVHGCWDSSPSTLLNTGLIQQHKLHSVVKPVLGKKQVREAGEGGEGGQAGGRGLYKYGCSLVV